MTERPVRTAAQISKAVGCTYARAEILLTLLRLRGLAEPAGSGYRRTADAEARYAVLEPAEVKSRQILRRIEANELDVCVFCGRDCDGQQADDTEPLPDRAAAVLAGSDFCSEACEREMRDAA